MDCNKEQRSRIKFKDSLLVKLREDGCVEHTNLFHTVDLLLKVE